MKTNLIIAIISLTVIYTVNAIPQNGRSRQRTRPRQNINDDQTDPMNDDFSSDINQDTIDEIFSSSPRSTTQAMRGAGVIVTPDPNYVPVPTTSPQMLTINQQQCTCVPYHMCDPRTNTVKNSTYDDDEVTGFGVIDIRFDPYDCQDVLDVCCIGPATREEPIPPKEKPNVPTQEAGCGVRNVNGLDFEISGNFVSVLQNQSIKSKCLS